MLSGLLVHLWNIAVPHIYISIFFQINVHNSLSPLKFSVLNLLLFFSTKFVSFLAPPRLLTSMILENLTAFYNCCITIIRILTHTFLIVEQCLACQNLIRILILNFFLCLLCHMICSFYERVLRRTQLFTVCKWNVNMFLLSDSVIGAQGYPTFSK